MPFNDGRERISLYSADQNFSGKRSTGHVGYIKADETSAVWIYHKSRKERTKIKYISTFSSENFSFYIDAQRLMFARCKTGTRLQ